jgi:hypothetical protein
MTAERVGVAEGDGACLSEVLRLLRRRRGLRTVDVARAMQMPLRSYEHFEAGRGRLNLERVKAFARVTNSDPYAILAAVDLGAPDLALACADNKLMLVLHLALDGFHKASPDRIAKLEARTLLMGFEALFEELAKAAEAGEAVLAAWIAGRLRDEPDDQDPDRD